MGHFDVLLKKNFLKIYDIIEYLILVLQILETLDVYTVRPELLHEVPFHFRSESQNWKLAILP